MVVVSRDTHIKESALTANTNTTDVQLIMNHFSKSLSLPDLLLYKLCRI